MYFAGELWRFSRRELANVLSLSQSVEFSGVILMLKIFENRFINTMKNPDPRNVSDRGTDQSPTHNTGPSLLEMMKKMDSQQDLIRDLLRKVDYQQETMQEAIALLTVQSAEIASMEASLRHGNSNGAVPKATKDDPRRKPVRLHPHNFDSYAAAVVCGAAVDCGAAVIQVCSAPSESPTAKSSAQHAAAARPTRAGLLQRSDSVEDTFLPVPTAESSKQCTSEWVHTITQMPLPIQSDGARSSSPSYGEAQKGHGGLSGALERATQRTMAKYKKQLEIARQIGDAEQEADALFHLQKWAKLMDGQIDHIAMRPSARVGGRATTG
jgi:hypothetical protein